MAGTQKKTQSFEERKVDLAILESQDAIQADAKNWDAHYNLASIYFSQKEYKLAEEIYLKILRAGNKSYAVFRGLGSVYYAQEKFKEAAENFEKAVELKYKDPESHYALAIVYYKLKQTDLFVQECTRALVVDPKFARAHYSMGFHYAQIKKYDQAIKELVKATKISPADPDAHFLLMKIYLKKNEEKKAMQECIETLKYNPKHIGAHFQQGQFAEKFEDYAMAVREYVEVKNLDPEYKKISEKIAETLKKEEEKYYKEMKKDPKSTKPYLSLADLYYEVGRLDLAAEKCEEALKKDPKNINAHSNLGVIYASANKYIKAIMEYKKALAVDAENASIKENLNLAIRLGLKYYRDLVNQDKQNVNAWDSLVLLYRESGDHIAVLDVYEEKLASLPKDKKAKEEYMQFGKDYLQYTLELIKKDKKEVYQVGLAYIVLGDLDAAQEVFQIILKNDPKNVPALYLVGKILSKKGELAESLEYFHKAYKINPSFRDTYLQIKNICSKEVEALKKKLKKDPENRKYLLDMAKIYETQQLYEEAYESFKRLAELDPENAEYGKKSKDNRDNLENQLKRYIEHAVLDKGMYLTLGRLYEEDRSISEAIKVYSRGLKLFTGDRELKEKHYNTSKKAVAEFEKYLAKDPNNAEVLYALAAFSATVGYQLKALDALEKAVAREKDLAERAKSAAEFKELHMNERFQEITHSKKQAGIIDQVVE